jgi:uncharacterized repeat protein (TIGR01451 family)
MLAILFAQTVFTSYTPHAQDGSVRRVNAPYFPGSIPWDQTAIFWFGKAELDANWSLPGRNYVDVRVAYNDENLYVMTHVVDYWLWYDEDPQPSDDLVQYDAIAVYLDTDGDRATNPQSDDYYFLDAWRAWPSYDAVEYHRQARGKGNGWDTTWNGHWRENVGANYACNPGPNSNSCGIDFGRTATFVLPWTTFGLAGPPSPSTKWGLGLILYDRDDEPPAGYVSPQGWPETFHTGSPATWGELVFGLPTYQPPAAPIEGTTEIRRGFDDSIVEDAWVGGGGDCSGGHEGDPDHDNHGGDTSLFFANQSLIADFPCFSKSFLRFHLDNIPPGKVIVSATLSLRQWSNANWEEAQPSLIWLLTVDENWEEYTLTWNNAPLARENLTTTWVNVITPDNDPGPPGVRYGWDATQAVAEAYAAEKPLNIALYTADTHFHSSKYFTSSETDDWNAAGRPTLTVQWGTAGPGLVKSASHATARMGDGVTYTLSLTGAGTEVFLSDSLPRGVVYYPDSLTGGARYDAGSNAVRWNGWLTATQTISFTYQVTITVPIPNTIVNTAILTDGICADMFSSATIIANPYLSHLPLLLRNEQ